MTEIDLSPKAIAQARARIGVPDEAIPRSVAIIMDGNGRWGRQRGKSRSAGHEEGGRNVRRIVTECARLGLEALTLYSFSIENWSRPAEEIKILMHLYAEYLRTERETMMSHNIRCRHLGRRQGLPDMVLEELDRTLHATASNTGMFFGLALNYGSRAEITDAVGRIAKQVAAGQLSPDQIDPATVSRNLDTADMPDPDLLIRTAGEVRLSNFLLWQISYSEFYVTDVYWPDFNEAEFHKAVIAYAARNRRFGGVDASNK
ncbi:MAG: isoprenyl transferase [Phycisphaerae bacterium]